jgi:hypothetical protein
MRSDFPEETLMTQTATSSASRRDPRRWSYAHRFAATVVGCIAGVALMAAAQIPVNRLEAGILSAQAPKAVGYMGTAPVVAQADVYLPVRFHGHATTVEPLPAH